MHFHGGVFLPISRRQKEDGCFGSERRRKVDDLDRPEMRAEAKSVRALFVLIGVAP